MSQSATYKWWRNTTKQPTCELSLEKMTELYNSCTIEPKPDEVDLITVMMVKAWCMGFAKVNEVNWIEIYLCLKTQEFI